MENIYLCKKDFDLSKEYDFFDVVYAISNKIEDNEIKSFWVCLIKVETSADKRCFNYGFKPFPITIYVKQQTEGYISYDELKRNYLFSKDKNEVVNMKNNLITKQVEKLKESLINK